MTALLLRAGAYGLPQLKGSSEFKLYDDFDEGYAFEYPRSWVGRSNRLREGIYVSDFNVSTALRTPLATWLKYNLDHDAVAPCKAECWCYLEWV
jgi:hypothetical protein